LTSFVQVGQETDEGAGAVGLAFANAVANHSYFREGRAKKIAVLDFKEPPKISSYKETPKEAVPEQRTSTLTPSSIRFLQDSGALEYVNEERFRPYHHIKVWERQGRGFLSFEQTDNREMGRTIENNHLVAAIYEALKKKNNVEFIFGDDISSLKPQDGHHRVLLKSGRELQYNLLVGSDGQKSKVKELKEISSHGWSHNQKAIVCTVETEYPTHGLWQRFIGDGPLALLSMWGNYVSVVWSLPNGKFDEVMELSDEAFLKKLNDTLSADPIQPLNVIQKYIQGGQRVEAPMV